MNQPGFPDEYTVPDPYGLFDASNHIQKGENNCTSHTFALMMEFQLSNLFKQRILIDVDDLWEKQKKFGTATREGDYIDGPWEIAISHGLKFKTQRGIIGFLYLSRTGKMSISWGRPRRINLKGIMRNFLKWILPSSVGHGLSEDHGPSNEQLKYNQEQHLAHGAGFEILDEGPNLTIEFSDTRLSEYIKAEFTGIFPLRIQIWNHAQQKSELERVAKKYQDDFKRGRLGGIGSPVPPEFIDLALFSVGIIFNWGFQHIIKDLDTKVWQILKTKIINLFRESGKKSNGQVAIVTSSRLFRREMPTISFILPSGLSEAQLQECLNFISTKTMEVIDGFLTGDSHDRNNFFQFTYEPADGKWKALEKRTG